MDVSHFTRAFDSNAGAFATLHRVHCDFAPALSAGAKIADVWLVAYRCGDETVRVDRVLPDGRAQPLAVIGDYVAAAEAGDFGIVFWIGDGPAVSDLARLPADASGPGELEPIAGPFDFHASPAGFLRVDAEGRPHLFVVTHSENNESASVWYRSGERRVIGPEVVAGAALDALGNPVLLYRQGEVYEILWWLGDRWRREPMSLPSDNDFGVRDMLVDGHTVHVSFAITRSARESWYASLELRAPPR